MKCLSSELRKHIPDAGIVLIIGSKGFGKSALGYGILNDIGDETDRDKFVYGFPEGKKDKVLPAQRTGIKLLKDFEPPDNTVVVYDEAYIQFFSRMHSSQANKFMARFGGLIRQKGILAIFISQELSKVDIAIRRSADLILIKPPSMGSLLEERSELRPLISKASRDFSKLQPPSGMGLEDYQKRCTYVTTSTLSFMIENSNNLPKFWSDKLSKAYEGISFTGSGGNGRRGKKSENWPPVRKSIPLDDILILG